MNGLNLSSIRPVMLLSLHFASIVGLFRFSFFQPGLHFLILQSDFQKNASIRFANLRRRVSHRASQGGPSCTRQLPHKRTVGIRDDEILQNAFLKVKENEHNSPPGTGGVAEGRGGSKVEMVLESRSEGVKTFV